VQDLGTLVRFAILGAMFGAVAMPIWATLTHTMPVAVAVGAGALGGIVGGAVTGAGAVLQQRLR
jgi:hypothetical protein